MSGITTGSRLAEEFHAICDCGGRRSGTESERAAVALLSEVGRAATGVKAVVQPVSYDGWSCRHAMLVGADGTMHPVTPLLRSAATPPDGIAGEVVVLWRGTEEEFAAHRDEVVNRIVVVRHELMFTPGTIHRRLKYRAAVEAGATAFLIAGPVPGALVAGSSGRRREPGIPAAGITPETAQALARTPKGLAEARLTITTEEAPATADNLFFELPGETDEWVVLSAHIDGHDLGESAIDNATGLAVALEVARRIAARGRRRRGLRLAFFNVEEWALTGSAAHVAGLSVAERNAIALNVNLDSVGGSDRLTALISGFSGLEPFLLGCAEAAAQPLGLYRPLQMNSDHGNFAQAGIPALRLVAGFGDHTAATRLVLTPLDRRDTVRMDELQRAADLTETIVWAALTADPAEVGRFRSPPTI